MLVPTAAPTVEPVSLAEARLHLKMTADDPPDQDSMIEGIWIPAARRHAEGVTGRSFITQSWRLVLDCFPQRIDLEKGPVQRIDSITYRDMAGATQTVTWAEPADGVQRSTDGTLAAILGDFAEIKPAFGCTWPIALPEIGAVAVTYTAGYGDAATDVPPGIKSWILLRVGMLDQNREEVTDGNVKELPHVDGLLDPFTIQRA